MAALAGNAAAGGLMLALAADEVWCRAGAGLNPHYRLMGLGATSGQDVTVAADGPDAEEAVAAIVAILAEATRVGA